jgi:two-component system, NtrC family, sensor kinase
MINKQRLFVCFYSTKEVGKGAGQGLVILRSMVVDEHGGSIDMESELGKGISIIVRLPIC